MQRGDFLHSSGRAKLYSVLIACTGSIAAARCAGMMLARRAQTRAPELPGSAPADRNYSPDKVPTTLTCLRQLRFGTPSARPIAAWKNAFANTPRTNPRVWRPMQCVLRSRPYALLRRMLLLHESPTAARTRASKASSPAIWATVRSRSKFASSCSGATCSQIALAPANLRHSALLSAKQMSANGRHLVQRNRCMCTSKLL